MPHIPGHIRSLSEIEEAFDSQRAPTRLLPEIEAAFDKQGLAEEVIARQGADPEGVTEGERGPSLLGRAGRALGRLGVRGIEVPKVTPALRRATDIAFKPFEAFAEGTFQRFTRRPDLLEVPSPVEDIQRLSGEFRERPLLQQLAIGLIDPTIALGGPKATGVRTGVKAFGPTATSEAAQAVAARRAGAFVTPKGPSLGVGLQGATRARQAQQLANTGVGPGPGFTGAPASAVQQPSPVQPRLKQQILDADDAVTRAVAADDFNAISSTMGERNRLTAQVDSNAVPEDVVARLRGEAPTDTPVLQRQGGRDITAEIQAAKASREAFAKGPTGVGGGTPPPARSAAAEIPEGDPILQKVIRAIRQGKRLGPERFERVAEFRSRQFRQGLRAQAGRPVLERDVAFRRAQFGKEADLPDITPLNVEFGPGEYEGLVQRIYDSPRIRQGTYDPFVTAEAFKKLFGPTGAKLPAPHELAMLERVFGREFVSAILSKRQLGTKVWDEFLQLWNLPRALLATGDLSASLRQAAPLGVNNRLRYKEAFKEQLKAFISEKSAQEAQDVLENHPRFVNYTRKKGVQDPRKARRLDLTSFDRSANFTQREESFMSRWSQNLPILRNSERAYVTMLNQLRFNVMDDMVKQSEKQLGRTLKEQELDHIASFINYATGRGPLGPAEAAAPFLNGMFFAPKFATSRFALPARFVSEAAQAATPGSVASRVSKVTGGTISATNRAVSRKMAVDLAAYVAVGVAMLKMLELGGVAEVSANPLSSDFGKARLGKTRIDVFSGFAQVSTLVARLYTGDAVSPTSGERFPLSDEFIFGDAGRGLEDVRIKKELPARGVALGRYIRGKLQPITSELLDQFTGEDFIGDEASPGQFTDLSLENPFYENLVPLFVQDVVDAVMEEGGTAGLKVIPSFFGAGANTYTSELDKEAEVRFNGARFINLSELEQKSVRDSLRKKRREAQLEKVRENQP